MKFHSFLGFTVTSKYRWCKDAFYPLQFNFAKIYTLQEGGGQHWAKIYYRVVHVVSVILILSGSCDKNSVCTKKIVVDLFFGYPVISSQKNNRKFIL